MATWAIGDLQGCWRTFATLLDAIGFNPQQDQLWLTGDLVNRGPDSLHVLRWMVRHDDVVTAVLGNHDLHLLARAAGLRNPGRRDTLHHVLEAPDRAELIAWVRERPLMHVERGFALVHAGLLPQWTLADAQSQADALSAELMNDPFSALLVRPPGDGPLAWKRESPALPVAITALTTLRCVDGKGRVVRRFNGPPENAPEGALPWFAARKRKWKGEATLLFGHWAALGHRRGKGWVSLDSGCIWGGSLTAYCLEEDEVVQVPSQEEKGAR